ncbi:mammalian cell entry protein [Mycobacterium intracellulare subsp. chimaera]|nr:mammalian cell entry protein [Mycobacterium intracellulare subsp. chimaera]
MRVRDVLSFIVFGVMIALAVGYMGSLGVWRELPRQRTDVSMNVADVSGLVVGSKVLLRGVPVGEVTKIEPSVAAATIDFYIREPFHVPVNSDVRLENLSALGESYIGLIPRTQSGPMLRNGQHIATESITQPPSISELATSVVRVLNQVDRGALERIIGEADTALPDTDSVLPNLSRSSILLRNAALDMHGRGAEALSHFQTLLRNAGWLGPVLAEFAPEVRSLGETFRAVYSTFPAIVGRGAPQILINFDDFLIRFQKLLDNNGGDLKVLGEAFQPHIKGIAGALLNFDTGQLLTNMLDSLPDDGTITLHVSIPKN